MRTVTSLALLTIAALLAWSGLNNDNGGTLVLAAFAAIVGGVEALGQGLTSDRIRNGKESTVGMVTAVVGAGTVALSILVWAQPATKFAWPAALLAAALGAVTIAMGTRHAIRKRRDEGAT